MQVKFRCMRLIALHYATSAMKRYDYSSSLAIRSRANLLYLVVSCVSHQNKIAIGPLPPRRYTGIVTAWIVSGSRMLGFLIALYQSDHPLPQCFSGAG